MSPTRSRACDRSVSTCHPEWNDPRVSKIISACARFSRLYMVHVPSRRDPDARGYFGEFGGRYVPETLVEPVEELERAYFAAREDAAFCAELAHLLKHYVGRPT